MSLNFKSKAYTCHPESTTCSNCRNPKLSQWRLYQTGMQQFQCPYGKPMVQLTVKEQQIIIKKEINVDKTSQKTNIVAKKGCGCSRSKKIKDN